VPVIAAWKPGPGMGGVRRLKAGTSQQGRPATAVHRTAGDVLVDEPLANDRAWTVKQDERPRPGDV
jgi:hypothetical protein